MKTLILCLFVFSQIASACMVYKGSYSTTVITRVQNNMVYAGAFSGTVIGRIVGSAVLKGTSGNEVAIRMIGSNVLKDKVIIAHTTGKILYKGQGSFTAIANSNDCTNIELQAASILPELHL